MRAAPPMGCYAIFGAVNKPGKPFFSFFLPWAKRRAKGSQSPTGDRDEARALDEDQRATTEVLVAVTTGGRALVGGSKVTMHRAIEVEMHP